MSKMSDKKNLIRKFVGQYYSDQNLHDALCHARDGKLGYWACCCLIGVVDAEHPLQAAVEHEEYGRTTPSLHHPRRSELRYQTCGGEAEIAWLESASGEAGRRRVLIPILRAEIKRRAKLRNASMIATPETTHEPAAEHTQELELKLTDTV